MPKSIGEQIIDRACLATVDAQPLAAEIDAAIADAFKVGFEHAVHGGKEAARKLPQIKNALPLVIYFVNDADRKEFSDAMHEAKPGLVECRIPEGRNG